MKQEQQSKRKPWIFLASLLLFAAGAGIFLYPAASNMLAEKNQKNVITAYEAQISSEDKTVLEEARRQAVMYNENLAGDPVHDPFVAGSGYVVPDNYEEVLNLNGDGVMGYVEIPKIDVNLPIYHGTSEEVLEKGVGHLDMTSLPIGGDGTHSVLSAHRGLPSAELFTRLDEMEIGDVFYIHVLGETLAYRADDIRTVLPEDLARITLKEGRDLVTLMTCTPYAVNTHRLLVRGTRVPYKEARESEKQQKEESRAVYYIPAAVAGAVFLAVFTAAKKKKKMKKAQK